MSLTFYDNYRRLLVCLGVEVSGYKIHSIEYFTNLKEVICLRGCFSVVYKGNVIRCKFWLIDSRTVWAAGEITPPVYIYVCTYVKIFACVWKHILVCVGGRSEVDVPNCSPVY